MNCEVIHLSKLIRATYINNGFSTLFLEIIKFDYALIDSETYNIRASGGAAFIVLSGAIARCLSLPYYKVYTGDF